MKGKELIKPYMLREPGEMGGSTFNVATCCHSIMCVDHPFYENNFCLVMAAGCKLDTDTTAPVMFKTNMESYDEKIRGPMPEKEYKLPGHYMEHMEEFMVTTSSVRPPDKDC